MGFPQFGFRHRKTTPDDHVPSQPSRNSLEITPQRSSPIPSFPLPVRKTKHQFKSYRLRGEYEKPWMGDKKIKRVRYNNYIVWGFIILAICLCGYLAYDGAQSAHQGEFCSVLEDHFENIDSGTWSHEVQIGGYGTGSFDWTTDDESNSFTDAEGLHIVPTLTTETTKITEDQIFNGYTLNLTKAGGDGSCTSDQNSDCAVRSNTTLGSVIPPVRSARLSTKGKKSIKYGKIEVVAKMPKGDWLWPAIWMMPEDSVYGPWPASGEIDIAELRGNSWHYPVGRDGMTSTLHWGPTSNTDAYYMAHNTKFLRRTDFSEGYHTFGLQWTKDYLFTYLDSRLKQVYYISFGKKETMWERGHFEGQTANQSVVQNPWEQTGRTNTPFDQNFYLILNVAVGAQNGWFYPGEANKPWVDGGKTAVGDFYKAKDQWLPTWGKGNDRGMSVKSVKMWKEGAC